MWSCHAFSGSSLSTREAVSILSQSSETASSQEMPGNTFLAHSSVGAAATTHESSLLIVYLLTFFIPCELTLLASPIISAGTSEKTSGSSPLMRMKHALFLHISSYPSAFHCGKYETAVSPPCRYFSFSARLSIYSTWTYEAPLW